MQINKLFERLEKIGIKNLDISIDERHLLKYRLFVALEKMAHQILEQTEEDAPTKPLTLNEEGWFLIKDSGFVDIFETCKDQLVQYVYVKFDPKTKYDVQESAREIMYCESHYDKSPFVVLKSYAYNNGKDYKKIIRSGWVLLRDYYLEKHPEITE